MRIFHWTFACSLAAAGVVALPAYAGPKEHSHGHTAHAGVIKHEAHEAREAAREHAAKGEKAKEAAEGAKEHGKAKGEDKGKNGEDKGADEAKKGDKGEHGDHKGPPEAVQKKLEQLRTTRKQRRAAAVARIKHKWGAAIDRPDVRAELKVHAWRMARLDRIRELASAENKTDIVTRVDKLIAKEQARHDKHMAVLDKQGGKK